MGAGCPKSAFQLARAQGLADWVTSGDLMPERADRLSNTQRGQEGFLRYLHAADLLHAALALFLLFEELAFAGYVATVAFGSNIFAVGANGLACYDTLAHGGLHWYLELLAWDQLFELLDECPAALVGLVAVDDDGERVHGVARDEDLDLHQVGRLVAEWLVVVGGVALGAALHRVEEVRDDLGQRHVVGELHPAGRDVLHPDGDAAPFVAEAHHGPYVPFGADHRRPHDRLPDLVEDLRELARVGDLDNLALDDDLVLHARRGRYEVEVELALQALLDDLHVQQAQKTAPEPEAHPGVLGLEEERGVVELQLREGVAEPLEVVTLRGIEAGEDRRQDLRVAWQRFRCRSIGPRDRVADAQGL